MEQAPVNLFIIKSLGLDLDSPAAPEQRIYEICNAQSIGAAVENYDAGGRRTGVRQPVDMRHLLHIRELNQWLGVREP